MKTCTKCGETKPLDDFPRNRGKADGRKSQCRKCDLERQRRWREENREKALECQRRYREENLDKEMERKRKWREENRDKVMESQRRYYEENRDKELERKRKWREENLDKQRERDRKYYEENRDYRRAAARAVQSESQAMSAELATVPPLTPWAEEEDAFLMADNGMTVFQKAVHLGRTYRSCRGRRVYLRQAVSA